MKCSPGMTQAGHLVLACLAGVLIALGAVIFSLTMQLQQP